MDQLILNQAPINETYRITGDNEPNTAVLTFRDNLIMEFTAYPGLTVSKFNQNIVIINNEVRLAVPGDSNIIPAGTEIRIDSNGMSFR